MSKSNASENALLLLIYNAVPWANMADNAAASPRTQLHVALHSADPGEAGDQTTNEIAYTGYGRVAVNRNAGGFTVTGNQVSNTGTVTFGACTGGTAVAAFFSVGQVASGASQIIHRGPIGPLTGIFGFSAATSDTLTVPGSTFAVDDRVSILQLEGVQQSPGAGLTPGTLYFVRSVTGESITLSLTSGGATIDVTGTGAGILQRHAVLNISAGITPTFAGGQLQVIEG